MAAPLITWDDPARLRRDHTELLLQRVARLQASESDALGFIPAAGLKRLALAGRLLIGRLDGHAAGYITWGGKRETLRIHQLVVARDCRLRGVGTCLLALALADGFRRGRSECIARVAADLPANAFWVRAGFVCERNEPGGSRRARRINVYRLPLS